MPLDEEGVKYTIDTTQAQAGVRDLAKEASALAAVMGTLDKANEEVAKGTEEYYHKLAAEIPIVDEVTAHVQTLTANLQTMTAAQKVATAELDAFTVVAYKAADPMETGSGFGGIAKNVFKAERVMDIFTHPDKGLARAGPMLESVTTALGMTSGVGFAITGLAFAYETLAPHIAKALGLIDTEKMKATAEHVQKIADHVTKMQAAKMDDPAKAMAEFLSGTNIRGMTEAAIGASGLSAQGTPEELKLASAKQEYVITKAGPVKTNDPEAAKKAMIERITTANRDLANQMIDKAVQPGQAGKEGRAFLRGLVQKNPGAFPPGFLEWLDSIEETPEEREAAEQKIEEEDPDQKFMMRHKAGMAQRNAVIDEWNKNLEKTKHAKAEALKKSREVNAYNKELDEMLGEDPASVKRAATLAEGKAKHEAHEALPEVINQRKMEAMKNDLMREAQARDRANQRRGGPAATPEFLNQTVAESMRAMTEGTSRRNAMDVGINRVSEKEALSRLSASKRGGDIANLGHMEEQVREEVTRAALRNMPGDFNLAMLSEWIRKAMADLPNTGNQIMPALQRTIWEVRAHLQHQNEMQNAQWQRMNGNQLFNSTQLNIGPS